MNLSYNQISDVCEIMVTRLSIKNLVNHRR